MSFSHPPSLLCYRHYCLPLSAIIFWIRERNHSSYFFRTGSYEQQTVWYCGWFLLMTLLVCMKRWPFDWKTPCGYLLAWFVEYVGLTAIVVTSTPLYCIVFGSCFLLIVIAKDITQDTVAFNTAVKTINAKDRTQLMKQFCKIVRNWEDAKRWVCRQILLNIFAFSSIWLLYDRSPIPINQLVKYIHFCRCFNDFDDMMKYSLLSFFLWNMLTTSSLLVTLQFQLVDFSFDANAIFVNFNVFELILFF